MNLKEFLDDFDANQINQSIAEFYDMLMEAGATTDQIDRIDEIINEILGE